ncbi:sorting nexin-6-like [Paramacrobiotus metropolitanus]|uniref:sorting nexin-6-like n=1 Tax=Paramacrobiotus metropolitanus TaxID=2943436 RepID=UPI0024463F91|nr:sorting nexin-6-like [Paramacrobiotus metropolitanus]
MLGDSDATHDIPIDKERKRAETVDLAESPLIVDISDAVSERDKVKFTVHTRTTLPAFRKPEFSVVREHEEFVWLHDRFLENPDYAGYIIPPSPPFPDFEASRRKLQQLGESEGLMTKEEFAKFKADLEAEYLALFKKTVAMHEAFLIRLATHPKLRDDMNFRVFLEYEQEIGIRGKNKREMFDSIKKAVFKQADDVLLSGQKDVDEYFEQQKSFLNEYHTHVKEAAKKSDTVVEKHKEVITDHVKMSSFMSQLAAAEQPALTKFLEDCSEILEKSRKTEFKKSADHDLKLTDTLLYYQRETQAAKDLCLRRARCLHDFEEATKNLEKAKMKNKDVHAAETHREECQKRFESITELARSELKDYRQRRVIAFRKGLVELAELELKHAKNHFQLLQTSLEALRSGRNGTA